MDESVEVVETAEETTEPTVDEKVDAAVKAAVKKLEADYQKKLDAAKKESERLSKLSEDEKRSAELENLRAELETKAQELKLKEIELEMSKVLDSRNIPLQFMEYFLTSDNEQTLSRIKTFEKIYNAAIEKAVNEKLKGKAPASSAPKLDAAPNLQDLQKLIRQNQRRR